jgi:DNA replication protein DnaC
METNFWEQKLKELRSSIKVNSSTRGTDNSQYECSICRDSEWIIDEKTNSARPCKCREAKQYQRILEASGISEAFRKKTFNNFIVKNEQIKAARDMAIDYCRNFDAIRDTEHNSIAFLGQVGSGKTHLSIAIANYLMKQHVGVRYMQYREDIMKIKQSAVDEIAYTREINKYKNATVLLIDDLYKGAVYKNRMGYEAVNEADLRAMFEIVNYRYLKKAPMIISSEYTVDQLLDFDEAIGSRIIEGCKGHIMELRGMELNYRLAN